MMGIRSGMLIRLHIIHLNRTLGLSLDKLTPTQ